jgi:chitinase
MRNLRVFLACCASAACFIVVAGAGSLAYGQAEPASATLTKRLVADYGYWSRTQDPPYSSEQIPFSRLTHINHAGVGFDSTGKLSVPYGFLEPELIDKAHDKGVKVMLLLGGDFPGVEATPGALHVLVKNVHAFINNHGYDGIDLDWEYPSGTADDAFFRSLLLDLRAVLPSPRYIISADVPPWGPDGYDFPDSKYIVDYFNVMTYDCAGPWTDSGQLNSEIFPDPNNPATYNCEPGGSVKEAIDIYEHDLKIPKTKLNIGTPFYGYYYHDINVLWGFCTNYDCSNSVDYLNYGTDFKPLINKNGWRTYYDPISLVPYMLREDGGPGFITYDDASSTFYRVAYSDWTRGVGGVFIWELDADYDGHSQDLLDAAYNASLPQTK